jgi:hypothetical protein
MSALGNGSGYFEYKTGGVLPNPNPTSTSGGNNINILKSDSMVGGKRRRKTMRCSKSRKLMLLNGGRKNRKSRRYKK